MLEQKLNVLAKKLFSNKGFNARLNSIQFYSGEMTEVFKNLLKTFSPSGKVALIATVDTAIKMGKVFGRAASSVGVTLVTYAFEDFTPSTENVSGLFSLSDDVRSVICCEADVMDFASYYSSVRKLPLFIVPLKTDVSGLLKDKIRLLTGEKIDDVSLKTNRHVIIDKNLIEKDFAGAYAFVMSKFIDLIDYRINHVVTGKIADKTAFDTIRQSVLSTYGVNKLKSGIDDVLIYNAFAVELATASSKGAIADCSSSVIASSLCGAKNSSGILLAFAMRIIKIYSALCNLDLDFTALTDVNAISEELSEHSGIEEEYFLSCIVDQIKSVTQKQAQISSFLAQSKKEINSFLNLSKNIYKTYVDFGGNNPEIPDYTFAITHCGDALNGVNGMTIARELGLI